MKFVSFFTGGGGADIGAQMAGLTPVAGYEYIPEIMAHAASQFKHHVYCQNILDLDPANIPPADFAHFSPPCPAFSVANNKKGETENDILLALKMAEIITIKKYRYLTIENVWGYRKSESWRIISSALNVVYGFGWDVHHINFADHGVPQTRKRMIVRAIKDKIIMPHLPQKQKWIGWYEAIEDLIPTLPDSQFAPWQIERLKDSPLGDLLVLGEHSGSNGRRYQEKDHPAFAVSTSANTKAFLMNPSTTTKNTERIESEPAQTVTADIGEKRKAFIVGQGTRSKPKEYNEPVDTITSNHNQAGIRLFENGKVKLITVRCNARFQTFPDSYELPSTKTLASKIIGNAVPPVGYAEIVRSMLNE